MTGPEPAAVLAWLAVGAAAASGGAGAGAHRRLDRLPAPGSDPGPRACVRARLARRRRADEVTLTGALPHVVTLLRAGRPAAQAWREAAGGPPERAAAGAVRGSVPDVVDAAVRMAEEFGIPLADLLDRVSGGIADAADAAVEREAALAAPRATARLLMGLPLAGIGLGTMIGADPLGVLLGGGLGSALGGAGLGLLLLGRAWVSRQVAAAARAGDDDGAWR